MSAELEARIRILEMEIGHRDVVIKGLVATIKVLRDAASGLANTLGSLTALFATQVTDLSEGEQEILVDVRAMLVDWQRSEMSFESFLRAVE